MLGNCKLLFHMIILWALVLCLDGGNGSEEKVKRENHSLVWTEMWGDNEKARELEGKYLSQAHIPFSPKVEEKGEEKKIILKSSFSLFCSIYSNGRRESWFPVFCFLSSSLPFFSTKKSIRDSLCHKFWPFTKLSLLIGLIYVVWREAKF